MHLLHIHFMHNLKFRDLGQSRQQRFSSRRRHSICSNFKMLESHLIQTICLNPAYSNQSVWIQFVWIQFVWIQSVWIQFVWIQFVWIQFVWIQSVWVQFLIQFVWIQSCSNPIWLTMSKNLQSFLKKLSF